MTESAFVTIHNIVTEPSLVSDELRIIAKDDLDLRAEVKDTMIRAADELESAHRAFHTVYADLVEARQQLAALREKGAIVALQPISGAATAAFVRT
jgi:hypothetical protein